VRRATAPMTAREIAEALIAEKAPQATRKQAIDLQAAILSAYGSATAEWWLVTVPPGAMALGGAGMKEAASIGGLRRPQAIRSVIRIIATALLALDACSLVFLLQVQTKFFLAVNCFPS